MSDTAEQTGPESTVNDLLAVGEQVRRRRGRPPGSKNRPKDGSEPTSKINQSTQRDILAGALIALFGILAVILGFFGYEYYNKLEFEEAQEGGKYLLPISQRFENIAKVANWLSFPAWLIQQINKRFRKQVEAPKGASPSPTNGNSDAASAPTSTVSPPNSEEEGFSPIPVPD